MRNRKGWVRLIEILLAAVLVFVFMAFIQQTQLSQYSEPPKWDSANLKMIGEDMIRTIDLKDADGNHVSDLRQIVAGGSLVPLCSEINSILPDNIGYALFKIDSSFTEAQVTGGTCTGTMPSLKEKVSINYMIAGGRGLPCDSNGPCAIKLVLWYKS